MPEFFRIAPPHNCIFLYRHSYQVSIEKPKHHYDNRMQCGLAWRSEHFLETNYLQATASLLAEVPAKSSAGVDQPIIISSWGKPQEPRSIKRSTHVVCVFFNVRYLTPFDFLKHQIPFNRIKKKYNDVLCITHNGSHL